MSKCLFKHSSQSGQVKETSGSADCGQAQSFRRRSIDRGKTLSVHLMILIGEFTDAPQLPYDPQRFETITLLAAASDDVPIDSDEEEEEREEEEEERVDEEEEEAAPPPPPPHKAPGIGKGNVLTMRQQKTSRKSQRVKTPSQKGS